MTTAIVNLQARQLLRSFTAVWDPRPEFNAPWELDGMAYASNRHWCVRIPSTDLGKLPAYVKGQHPDARPSFDAAPFDRLAPMQDFSRPTPCLDCAGLGKVLSIPCRCCDRKPAAAPHSRFECDACQGTGLEPVPYQANTPYQTDRCPDCSGTSWAFIGRAQVMYGNQWFKPGYLQVISQLPGVLFANCPDPQKPAAFAWDGGQGVLMPCHPPKTGAQHTPKGVH